MTLRLARIDDRLIHGQVVVGCCEALGAERIVLVDDEVATDPMLREVYGAATLPPLRAEILAVREAVTELADRLADGVATVLVVGRPSTLLELVEGGVRLPGVNVGGLHHGEGRVERWPGVWIDDRELQALAALAERGLRVELQKVPGAPSVDVTEELRALASGDSR